MPEQPHKSCPYTDCSSSDAFSFNTEGYGFCHSCNGKWPQGSKDKNRKTFEWALEEYPVPERKKDTDKWWSKEASKVSYKGIRGLDEDVAKFYGIQAQYDESGELYRYAIKWPLTVQYRKINDEQEGPKYKSKSGVNFNNQLGGPDFNAGSSKKLYLTEGAFDAASLYQAMGKTFPVKPIPSSSVSDDFIKRNHDYLSSFEQIVYAGELDKAGRSAADRLYTAYPEKFYFVPLTKWKDANEFLMNGDSEELKWAALKPQRYSPENFFCSDQEFEQILLDENPYEAIPTGHAGIDYMTRGLVRGGATFIKAPPGTGKTEIIRYMEMAMLATDDIKIAAIHMEEQKSTTLRAMATYELGVNVRTKEDAEENGVDEKDVRAAALKAAQGDRTIIFEMRATDDPLKIVEYISLAARIYGADFVFVDHVQRLTYLAGVDGATNTLTRIAANTAQLCKELNIGVIFISHVNEDGKTKYATSLEEEAIICINISRDKNSEDDTVRNTTNLEVTKNRPFSRLGHAGLLYFDPVTTVLSEVNSDV